MLGFRKYEKYETMFHSIEIEAEISPGTVVSQVNSRKVASNGSSLSSIFLQGSTTKERNVRDVENLSNDKFREIPGSVMPLVYLVDEFL